VLNVSKIKNQKSKILFGFLSLIVFGASVANAAVEVVLPSDTKGWFEKNGSTGVMDFSDVQKHGNQLIPTGSLLLETDGSAGQIIQAARVPIPLVTVADFTVISWDVYTDNATNYPAPRIEYWWIGPGKSGTLRYDTSNLTPALYSWQTMTVDFNKDTWTDSTSGQSKTLAEWQATTALGGVGEIPSNFFYIGYGSTGGAFAATTAYADLVHLETTKSDDTWDFEFAAGPPPTELGSPNVSITKTLDTAGPYTAGDTITYTVTVTNAGPTDEAKNTIVIDQPTNLTITSVASASCTEFPCAIPLLAVGASEVITVMATIDAAGAFDNSAGAYAFVDPDISDNIDNTGNGGTAVAPPPLPTYTVGGTLSGLAGSVTLQNNGADDFIASTDGPFSFATALADSSAYAVTVLNQPTVRTTTGQTCTVSGGSGTISGANVSSVSVSCVNNNAPPVTPPTSGPSKPIPTLSEWGLILMSGLLGLAVFIRQRKLL